MGDIDDAIKSLKTARKALLAAAEAAKDKSATGAVHAAEAAASAAKAHATDAETAVNDAADAARGEPKTPHDPSAELKAAQRLEELTTKVVEALRGKKASRGDDNDERANVDEKSARLELLAEEVHDVLARAQAESL